MKVGPSPARARVRRLDGRLVDGEHVTAVDAQTRHPVAGRLVGERLRAGLCGERRRDRPLVVVAEENDRRAHDGGEVRTLVEGALGCRSVTEVDDRTVAPALQLCAPRVADRVGDVRGDRHGDRRDAELLRVPPAGRMAPPPGEHRLGRHPAKEADRRLAVGREDPVLVCEGVRRPDLHRLVPPEDRIRPDPALPVVDERALVVGSQEHHGPIEVQKSSVVETLDLAVRHLFPIADDPPNVMLGRKHLCHAPKYRPRRP